MCNTVLLTIIRGPELAASTIPDWGMGLVSRLGLRWMLLANVNTCGVQAGGICRQFTATVLANGYFSGEICWVFCRAGHCELQTLPLCGCYCRSMLLLPFPAISTPLSFAILGGVKPKQDLCSVTRKAMESLLFLAKWSSLSHVQLFATPMDYTTMEFSRPEYWSGYPPPSPGDLPNPGIEPRSSALQADSLPAEPQGKPFFLGKGSPFLLGGPSRHRVTGEGWPGKLNL